MSVCIYNMPLISYHMETQTDIVPSTVGINLFMAIWNAYEYVV